MLELSFQRTFAPGTFMELSFPGTFAPRNESSLEVSFSGTFAPWNFRFLPRTIALRVKFFDRPNNSKY